MKYANFLGKKIFLHENDQVSTWLEEDCSKYELHLVEVFNKYIKEGFTIIEGGSHLGMHTVRLSDLAKDGRVYTFEASKRSYDKLNQTIQFNGISNVSLYNKALHRENTIVSLHEHQFADQDSVSTELIGGNQVDAVCLDSMDFGKVDFIKLDVEGFEYFVIEGAVELINRDKPIIVYEYLPNTPENMNPRPLLESLGYDVVQLETDGNKHWDYLAIHKSSL